MFLYKQCKRQGEGVTTLHHRHHIRVDPFVPHLRLQRFIRAFEAGEVCMVNISKETPRRRITVTSSLNKISMEQLENMVVWRGGGVTPPASIQASRQLYKYNVNNFSSTSNVCFMFSTYDVCPEPFKTHGDKSILIFKL